MIHELVAEVELLEYALHSDEPSVTGHFGWRAFYLPGPRSQVTTNVEGNSGELNALSSRSSPDQTTVGVTPAGPIDVRIADGSEYLSWIVAKDTRLSQSLFGTYTSTDDNVVSPGPTKTTAAEAGGAFGIEHNFRSDSIGLEAGASVLRFERVAAPGVDPPSRLDRQLNPKVIGIWRHDIDKHWSVNADGGLVYVHPYGKDPYNPMAVRHPGTFPIIGGVVAYTEQWGRAILSVRRTVAPNLLIAMNTVDDIALAQVALPLPWLDPDVHLRTPKLVGLGSFGLERTQLVDPTSGMTNGDYQLARIDAGLAYTPRPGQTWGVRYEATYQHASSIANSILPTAPSYFRNALYFTFALRYPDRIAATVPRRSESVRADRKDLSPVGAEPVVPDPIEPMEDDDTSNDRR
jgi:hypothetical protein